MHACTRERCSLSGALSPGTLHSITPRPFTATDKRGETPVRLSHLLTRLAALPSPSKPKGSHCYLDIPGNPASRRSHLLARSTQHIHGQGAVLPPVPALIGGPRLVSEWCAVRDTAQPPPPLPRPRPRPRPAAPLSRAPFPPTLPQSAPGACRHCTATHTPRDCGQTSQWSTHSREGGRPSCSPRTTRETLHQRTPSPRRRGLSSWTTT